MPLERRLRRGRGNLRRLEILIAAVKLMNADWPSNKELLVHCEMFVDSLVEETFIWISEAFFMAGITKHLNSEVFYHRRIQPIT